ncbi:MAG: alpha-galactosidase, partial [Alphaproteobacteria bacterium]
MSAAALQTWRLDDGRQTLVLASEGGALPAVVWWGAPLPAGEDLAELARAGRPDLTGGMLDALAPVTLLPLAGRGFAGVPGLAGRDGAGRPLEPRLVLTAVEAEEGALRFRAEDGEAGLAWEAAIAADAASGVLTLQAALEAREPITVDWLAAPVLPLPPAARRLTEFTGGWIGEMRPVQSALAPGLRARDNRTGRSDHAHFPGLLLEAEGATEAAGEVWQLAYGWPGGHGHAVEVFADGRGQIQFGHARGSWRGPARRFATAPLYAAWSGQGRA